MIMCVQTKAVKGQSWEINLNTTWLQNLSKGYSFQLSLWLPDYWYSEAQTQWRSGINDSPVAQYTCLSLTVSAGRCSDHTAVLVCWSVHGRTADIRVRFTQKAVVQRCISSPPPAKSDRFVAVGSVDSLTPKQTHFCAPSLRYNKTAADWSGWSYGAHARSWRALIGRFHGNASPINFLFKKIKITK